MRGVAAGLVALAIGACGDEAGQGDTGADETGPSDTTDTRDSGDGGDTADTADTADTDHEGDTVHADTSAPDAPRHTWPLVAARYGVLETVAGRGQQRDEGNEWLAAYEGGPATACELSRPHMAMADRADRVFIADKEAHAVRRVDPDGTIVTVAGTGAPGDDGDAPGPGALRRLTDPNGLYVIDVEGGTYAVHILDEGNGKVRRLGAEGELTTFITIPGGVVTGRGLWVAPDESSAFIASGDRVLRWTPGDGVTVYAQGFIELGNLVVDPSGALVVTDRGGHRVYRVAADGTRTPIAGNGTTTGGGDGAPALESGLEEPRAVWFGPDDVPGGFFVGTHEGNQVWYVDGEGELHLFLDGGNQHAHCCDGQAFNTPGEKVSEVRAITIAPNGDLLITENDYGFIRRVKRR